MKHACSPPMVDNTYYMPSLSFNSSAQGSNVIITEPDRSAGTVWRCPDCGRRWRIGHACDTCDHYGQHVTGAGHAVGVIWRHASWWQYRKGMRS